MEKLRQSTDRRINGEVNALWFYVRFVRRRKNNKPQVLRVDRSARGLFYLPTTAILDPTQDHSSNGIQLI